MIITAIIMVSGIVYLLKRKNKTIKISEPEPEIKTPIVRTPIVRIPKIKTIGERKYPKHNNRKKTKGRKIQYIELNGTSKPIYHDVIQ
jgi:hypothetical protein